MFEIRKLTCIGTVFPPRELILDRVLKSSSSFCANCKAKRHFKCSKSVAMGFTRLKTWPMRRNDKLTANKSDCETRSGALSKTGSEPHSYKSVQGTSLFGPEECRTWSKFASICLKTMTLDPSSNCCV